MMIFAAVLTCLSLLLPVTYGFPSGGPEMVVYNADGSVFDSTHLYAASQWNCSRSGIFPVKGSCTAFYICANAIDGQSIWSVFIFICPGKTIFNETMQLCIIPYSSETQQGCLDLKQSTVTGSRRSPIAFIEDAGDETSTKTSVKEIRRLKRSSARVLHCDTESINTIVSGAKKLCGDITVVDSYINHVKAMEQSESPTVDSGEYLRILRNFNDDLETAQNNTNVWRGENGVLAAINETILSAKNFGTVFEGEFKRNLERVGVIVNTEGLVTSHMNEVLQNITKQITEMKELETMVKDSADFGLLNRQIKSLRKRKGVMEKIYEKNAAIYELPELISFLETIWEGTSKIKMEAEHAENKIADFEFKVTQDSSKFKRHLSIAKYSISELGNDMEENQREQENVKSNMQELSRQSSGARADLAEKLKLKEEAEYRLSMLRGGRSKRNPVYPLVFFGGAILGLWAINEVLEEDKPSYWEIKIRDYRTTINHLQHQINLFKQDIIAYDQRLSSLQSKSELLEREISSFHQLLKIFHILKDEVQDIVDPVNEAKGSIQRIRGVFEGITQRLEDIVSEAKRSVTELEKRNIRYLIYNNISEMKCFWGEVRDRLALFVSCY